MEEVYASHESRNLVGFEIKMAGRGYDRHIMSMTLTMDDRLIAAKNT